MTNRAAYLNWLIAALCLLLALCSCRTVYVVTRHHHCPNGAYYYRLADSIDYVGYDRGMGKHRCHSVMRVRPGRVRRY